MKKIIKLLSIFLISFIVVACSSAKSKTFVNESTGIKMEYTYTYKDDKVLSQSALNTITYSEIGITKDQFQLAISSAANAYKGIDGIEHAIELKDDVAIEKLNIDYTKVDFAKIKDLPGIMLSGDAKSISMVKSEEMLKEAGFNEKQ